MTMMTRHWRLSCRMFRTATISRRGITTNLSADAVDVSSGLFLDKSYVDSFTRKEPLLLHNLATTWPAVADTTKNWANIDNLISRFSKKGNDNLVRVEIGENYMDPNVQVEYMPMTKVLGRINDSLSRSRIYLAQQELVEIPTLIDDILVPQMCQVTGYKRVYKTNIWLGGKAGTISPCHYDPYDNILVQISGEKEIILFNPSQSDLLYPALGTMQKNTSNVNIQSPDYTLHPLAKNLRGYRIHLRAGDGLYIPKKWWHFVSSAGLSCSVNYWWL